MIIVLISSIIYLPSGVLYAQQDTVLTLNDVVAFEVDGNNNLYVAEKGGGITKYDASFQAIADFRQIRNGPVYNIDASDPLQILVLYSDFSKLVILDRMMSPKFELDLTKINLINPKVIAQSKDGNIWTYDPMNYKLLKINQQLETIIESNDNRLQDGTAPNPTHMKEQNDRVIMSDPQTGIYIFDQFGTLINRLEIKHVNDFQLIDDLILFIQGDSLVAYNLILKSLITQPSYIPQSSQFRMNRSSFFYLKDNVLYIIEHRKASKNKIGNIEGNSY